MKLLILYIRSIIVLILILLNINKAKTQHNSVLDSVIIVHNKSIKVYDLLDLIEKDDGISLTYSPGQIDDTLEIGVCPTPCSALDYLNKIAKKANLEMKINGSEIYLIKNYARSNSYTNNSLSGFVKDYETGEALLGATIYSMKNKKGKATNNDGYFYFDDISDGDTIRISYIGYSPLLLYNNGEGNLQSIYYLKKENILKDVIINSRNRFDVFSFRKFNDYNSLISLGENTSSLGNNDALKELTQIAGIEKINDLQGGISINGLAPHDNVYLLDGIRIFEPNHIFGLFSSFSKSSINKISLYSNYSPSNFSNSFSGVVNSHLIEGNYKKHTAEFSIGNSNVGLFVSGPLVKYKTTYFIDLRKSILNFYIPQLVKKNLYFENLDFYDINFKITHRISMGNKFNIFFYRGHDNIRINNSLKYLNTTNRYTWGNFAYGFKWAFLFANTIRSDVTLALSGYTNNSNSIFEFRKTPYEKSYLSIFSLTDIKKGFFKHDFKFYSDRSILKIGYEFAQYSLLPTLRGNVSENIIEVNSLVQPEGDSTYTDVSAYISNEYTYSVFKLNAGFKIGYLYNDQSDDFYLNPKIKMNVKVSDKSIFSISFMKSSKFVHSLGSYSVGIPSMIWAISDNNIPISESYNYSINYIYSSGRFSFGAELYYKSLINILKYKEIADIFNPVSSKGIVLPALSLNDDINKNIIIGDGKAYGINLSSKYNIGNLSLDYSFAINKVYYLFDKINHSKEFVGKYDLNYSSFFGMRFKFKKFHFLLDWHLHSGQIFTVPEYIYKDINNNEVLDYSLRNNRRMDYYNSVSLGINYAMNKKNTKYIVSGGVSNILNGFNPIYAYLYKSSDVYHVSQVSGLPILPYLRINIKI